MLTYYETNKNRDHNRATELINLKQRQLFIIYILLLLSEVYNTAPVSPCAEYEMDYHMIFTARHA